MSFKVPSVLRIDAMGVGHADKLKTPQGFCPIPQDSHQGPEPLEGPKTLLPEEVVCYAGKVPGFHATQAWVQVWDAVSCVTLNK